MVSAGVRKIVCLQAVLFCVNVLAAAQQLPAQLDASGQIVIAGRSTPYLIRHLPVSSFPELPAVVAIQLNQRECLIPQTYEAHRPENVLHASFERAGSGDWAVLCSARGTVTLLVFFASAYAQPMVLATAPETERLQARNPSGALGFNWGIDAATPDNVREVQAGMEHRPAGVDHDALADSVIDHRTVYHYYAKSVWTLLETPLE